MVILGIETSCDETAVGIVDSSGNILSNVLYSQIKTHIFYGGVVPEVAAREHEELIDIIISQSLKEAKLKPEQIDGFAATCGPGLVGGLIVGALAGKTMSAIYKKPFIAVNHLQGHALMPSLEHNIEYPFLLLLVSGGHTQFVAVRDVDCYEILGETIDDAIGEAFDKSARMMGLPYPGGKEIQILASKGDKHKYIFPMPLKGQSSCDFSFSGLKTSVRTMLSKLGNITEREKADISASLQYTIANIVLERSKKAIEMFEAKYGKLNTFVLSGGVSANLEIRAALHNMLNLRNIAFNVPPVHLCTDNGVMIAWAGLLKLQQLQARGIDIGVYGDIHAKINPRWTLQSLNKEKY